MTKKAAKLLDRNLVYRIFIHMDNIQKPVEVTDCSWHKAISKAKDELLYLFLDAADDERTISQQEVRDAVDNQFFAWIEFHDEFMKKDSFNPYEETKYDSLGVADEVWSLIDKNRK